MITSNYKNINKRFVLLLLSSVWIGLLFFSGLWKDALDYGAFFLLGIVGAIFANSTGAGGGVVFVPFFNQLMISSDQIIATSFAIQCCGMTAGALSWHRHYKKVTGNLTKPQVSVDERVKVSNLATDVRLMEEGGQWQSLVKTLLFTTPFSVLGIWVAQYAVYDLTGLVQSGLPLYFGIFSIFLGLAILGSIPIMRRARVRLSLDNADKVALTVIGFLGGMVTAWLSVGVGELVAVYLILRGFNTSFSIAVAVILSAFSVHSGVYYHIFISHDIYWQILIFAGAGAVVGGLIAKHVVLWFSPPKLKVFFATWVLFMGIVGLPLFD